MFEITNIHKCIEIEIEFLLFPSTVLPRIQCIIMQLSSVIKNT